MRDLTPEDLQQLTTELAQFYRSDNQEGFLGQFYSWVVDNWATREYFICDPAQQGASTGHHPTASGVPLREKVSRYDAFLNACTGATLPTSPNGQPREPKLIIDVLHEVWFMAGVEFCMRYSADHRLALPSAEISEVPTPTVHNRIIHGFARAELETEREAILAIISDGVHPDYLSGYTAPQEFHNGLFGTWTLNDFIEAAQLFTCTPSVNTTVH